MTSRRTLPHSATLGRPLREAPGLHRASQARVAQGGLRAAPAFDEMRREAAARVRHAAEAVRDDLHATVGAVRNGTVGRSRRAGSSDASEAIGRQ